MTGSIYFAYDMILNAIKVGCTAHDDVYVRINQQPGLVLLHSVACLGNLERTEARVLYSFRSSHLHGERFYPDRACVALLARIIDQGLEAAIISEQDFLVERGFTNRYRPRSRNDAGRVHPTRKYVAAAYANLSEDERFSTIECRYGGPCEFMSCRQIPSLNEILERYPPSARISNGKLKYRRRGGCREFFGIEISPGVVV